MTLSDMIQACKPYCEIDAAILADALSDEGVDIRHEAERSALRLPTFVGRVKFFFEHAPFCYDPSRETPDTGRVRCAVALARAEQWACYEECDYQWEDDDELPGCVGCVMTHPSGQSDSIWGLDVRGQLRRRIVRAELALALMERVGAPCS